MKVKKIKMGLINTPRYDVNLSQEEFLLLAEALKKLKPNRSEQIDEFLSGLKFYGTALNEPGKILELKYEALDFRKGDNMCMIRFNVLNDWGSGIMYSIFQYGKKFSLNKEDLICK